MGSSPPVGPLAASSHGHMIGGDGRPTQWSTGAVSERPRSVAIVDDDSGFLQVLSKRLANAGWQYRVLGSPMSIDAVVEMRLQAVVIDLAVLGPQAWAYLETLCQRLPHLAVVVCMGQSTVAQRVRGLRLGADDWLTKPCHPEELIARVEAVVRRRRRAETRSPRPVIVGEVELRADQFQAFIDGVSADLTRREFELIQLLAAAEGQVLPREEIYARVWGYSMARGDRSVDVFVRKLRQKLVRLSPQRRYIHTHYGIGYRFAAEQADRLAAPRCEPIAARPAPANPAWDTAAADDLLTATATTSAMLGRLR